MYSDGVEKGLLDGPDDFYNKFSNSDRITVNFTKFSTEKCYEWLYEVNKELILAYYYHSSIHPLSGGDMKEAQSIIGNFYNLYFNDLSTFRGVRHFEN